MPSPIAHAAMGYVIYRGVRRWPSGERRLAGLPVLLLFTAGLSLLPDLDILLGLATGDFARYHNNGSHSLVIGLAIALAAAWFARWRWGGAFLTWFGAAYPSYALHVLMDALVLEGRGVMLFWPFSTERYLSPVCFFFGVRWSTTPWTLDHLVTTIASELLFALLAFWLSALIERRSAWRQAEPGWWKTAKARLLTIVGYRGVNPAAAPPADRGRGRAR